jgi:hypothetical protein
MNRLLTWRIETMKMRSMALMLGAFSALVGMAFTPACGGSGSGGTGGGSAGGGGSKSSSNGGAGGGSTACQDHCASALNDNGGVCSSDSAGVMDFSALVTCGMSMCASDCADFSDTTAPSSACGTCLQSMCDTEFTACSGDA